jgi:hypothetical protein
MRTTKRLAEVKAPVAQADMPGEWTEQVTEHVTAQVIDQYTEQSPRWTKGIQEEYVLAAIALNITIPQKRSLFICFGCHFARMTSLLALPDQDSRWILKTQQPLNGEGSKNVFHASSNENKRQPSITAGRSWT